MTRIRLTIIPLLISLICAAETKAESEKETLKVTPIGRIHVDGALYMPDKSGFTDGASLPEIRAGVKAIYGQWMARIEIGYSYSKIGMKDVYIQRTLNTANALRLGYFIPEFGIRGGGSASFKPAMIQQIPESFFRTTTRKIGVQYNHYDKIWSASATLFTGGRSLIFNASQQGKLSAGAAARATWHPLAKTGEVVQIGLSASYETASHTRIIDGDGDEAASDGFRTFSATFPTAVSSVPLLQAEITDAKGDWKVSPELILSKGRFALESQYYHLTANRKYGYPAYNANGVFAMIRCLVIGDSKYSYSTTESALALPSPKTLEIVGGYSYTDANSHNRKAESASVYGGIASDYSVTASYYINKYMIARLRYSYTDVHDSPVAPRGSINALQARLQFVF